MKNDFSLLVNYGIIVKLLQYCIVINENKEVKTMKTCVSLLLMVVVLAGPTYAGVYECLYSACCATEQPCSEHDLSKFNCTHSDDAENCCIPVSTTSAMRMMHSVNVPHTAFNSFCTPQLNKRPVVPPPDPGTGYAT